MFFMLRRDLHLLKNGESFPRMKLSLDNLSRLSNKVLDLYQKDDPFTVSMSKHDGSYITIKSFQTQQTNVQLKPAEIHQSAFDIILSIIITIE